MTVSLEVTVATRTYYLPRNVSSEATIATFAPSDKAELPTVTGSLATASRCGGHRVRRQSASRDDGETDLTRFGRHC